jgi:hypothetical protein
VGKPWQWRDTITPVDKITVANAEQCTTLLTGEGQLHARVDGTRGGGAEKISERLRPASSLIGFIPPIAVDS